MGLFVPGCFYTQHRFGGKRCRGRKCPRFLWADGRTAHTGDALLWISLIGVFCSLLVQLLNKKIKQEVPAAAKRYRDELLAEINADREAHGKKPFDDDDDPPRPTKKKRDNTSKKKLARRKKAGFKTVTKSTTDPDCGMFVKGKHERQFAYEAHTACDKNGYVLETVVTPGNVHDSVAFDDVYDKVTESFPQIETIVADSAYKTPHICKKVFTDGRVLSTAYKRPMTMKGGHEWWKYVYDEYYDCVICPEYQPLAYRTTNRDGYREYCSDPKICAQCPTRYLCTRSKNCVKTVLRHVWKDYEELADDARYTPEYKELYAKRKETIERVFADAKEKHGMRYTLYRGLAQVSKWVRLKFAAMNLKRLARWKALRTSFPLLPFSLLYFRTRILEKSIRVLRQAESGVVYNPGLKNFFYRALISTQSRRYVVQNEDKVP